MIKHIPVLLDAVMETIGNIDGANVLDATFGAGGYSRAFLNAGANVTAFDRDPNVIPDANALGTEYPGKFHFIPQPFSGMRNLQDTFDAIVFDLGISSMQIDNPERGFSFRTDAPLDMRMSMDGPTIRDMFNVWTVQDLTKILRDYGDVKPAAAIAKSIKEQMPQTTFELKALVYNPRDVAPVFQALRIALNDEMGELQTALAAIPTLLKPGGRCICVTFHSLEDRIVKNAFRALVKTDGDPRLPSTAAPAFRLIKTKLPNQDEIERNSRAHSAHMRAVVKSY